MQDLIRRMWYRGVLGTFLTGLLFALPLALTVAIVAWLVTQVDAVLGPNSWLGAWLARWGGALLGPHQERLAFWLGLALALGGIWLLGFVVRTRARRALETGMRALMQRLPLVGWVYNLARQVVGMVRPGDAGGDIKGMSVVLCRFGNENGARVLALLTGPTVYQVDGARYLLVYLPTSPLPLSGGLTFVPVRSVTPMPGMNVDSLMRIYVSLGALGREAMPAQFVVKRG